MNEIPVTQSPESGLNAFRRDDRTAPPPNPAHGGQSKEQPTYYSLRGIHYDQDPVEDVNNTIEVLVIFAGLFSAVVTAFISQTYPMLQRDPKDIQTSIYIFNCGTQELARLWMSHLWLHHMQ